LWINPSNATTRDIGNGDKVEVFNAHGRLRIPAYVTEDIAPGVVCLYEGVWAEFDVHGVETAGSVNVLSSTRGTDPSKGSTTHGIPVEVVKAAGKKEK
jgi:anaerobic dimethyl sulfoxide reductase subunit A